MIGTTTEPSPSSRNALSELRLLVVDDDVPVRRVVRRALDREGATVDEAADGPTALQLHTAVPYDVIILDHYLPGMTGLHVLDALRQDDTDVRVIMLTGAASETDRVQGLTRGADDYVPKPFSVHELVARIEVLQRRRSHDVLTVLEIAEVQIDAAAGTVTVNGHPVDLRRRELDLLHHLASHPGRTFTRDDLLKAVWRSSPEWQSAATVTEHVRRLRQKIEPPAGRRLITTVRNRGYRFEVDTASPATPRPSALVQAAHDIANRLTVIATTAELATAEITNAPIGELLRQALCDDLRTIKDATIDAASLTSRLVVQHPDELDPLDTTSKPTDPSAPDDHVTVLLVEDDPDLRTMTERTLRKHGYDVLSAADGETALDLYQAHQDRITLVVTDIAVGDIALGEVAARIRALSPSMRILYMSGFSREVLVSADVIPDDARLLSKPFTASMFLSAVQDVLSHGRPRKIQSAPVR